MTHHYPDRRGKFEPISKFQPIRSTTHIWVVTRRQYGVSALVSQTPFRGETSGGIAKCRLFSQATLTVNDR